MIYSLESRRPQLDANAYVAPNASVIGDVTLGAETSVWFGAVLRGDVERLVLGQGSNIQDNCVLHSDPGAPLTIGDFVTVGHAAVLHGCTIGNFSLVGTGATILNHARIGMNSIVGANSLVTEGKNFPDGVLIIGSPARVARTLTAEELAMLPMSAQRYMERGRLYRTALRQT